MHYCKFTQMTSSIFITWILYFLKAPIRFWSFLIQLVFNEIILVQDSQILSSRRKCLSCLCRTLGLITVPGFFMRTPNGLALDMMDIPDKPVCRNCGGSGAIICKNPFFPPLFFSYIWLFWQSITWKTNYLWLYCEVNFKPFHIRNSNAT